MKKIITYLCLVVLIFAMAGCGKQSKASSAKSCEEVLNNFCQAYSTEDYQLAVRQYPPAFLITYEISESNLITYMKGRRGRIVSQCGSERFTLTYITTEDPHPIDLAAVEQNYNFEAGTVTAAKFISVDFYVDAKKVSYIDSLFVCLNDSWYICDDEAP